MIEDIISYLANNKNSNKDDLIKLGLSNNELNKIVLTSSELKIKFCFNYVTGNYCKKNDLELIFKKKMYFLNAKIILFNNFEKEISYESKREIGK